MLRPASSSGAPPRPVLDDAVRGIGFIALGYVIVSCADAAVKWALPQVGPAAAMIWRGVFGAIAIALLARGAPLRPVNRRLIGGRSLLHCAVTLIFYIAWARAMPLADTYAVAAVAPLLMTLLAIPLLGETVGWRRWTSTGVGFLGVLVMLQPGGALWRWEAAMLLAGMGFLALTRIWTRLLTRTDSPATIAFWLLLTHIPVGLALLPFFPPPALLPDTRTVLALVFLGLANGAAHFLFARAFALAPVSVLAPFEYTTLVWGLLLGLAVWGEFPAAATLAGACIVIAAGLYNLHRERVRAREARRVARLDAAGAAARMEAAR
ncbi:DMT family transporter [Teichococcus rhizosphaerae]|uniref:DMT family transporter n=1 Tax=Teichococcus rhizosphaerae TaxID=1335062 RepID=UPI001FE83A15|nr:DMT family transporter [Pseudoroseomonas rhizosphaerae]